MEEKAKAIVDGLNILIKDKDRGATMRFKSHSYTVHGFWCEIFKNVFEGPEKDFIKLYTVTTKNKDVATIYRDDQFEFNDNKFFVFNPDGSQKTTIKILQK